MPRIGDLFDYGKGMPTPLFWCLWKGIPSPLFPNVYGRECYLHFFPVFMEGNATDWRPLIAEGNAISTFSRCLWKGMPLISNQNSKEIILPILIPFF
jgi:hypothetical protein